MPVGDELGCSVGKAVGARVGISDGALKTAVGISVGSMVGAADSTVGTTVGVAVIGDPVGWSVDGAVDGAVDGGVVTASVGVTVGGRERLVGPLVDGGWVGALVGTSIGAKVGRTQLHSNEGAESVHVTLVAAEHCVRGVVVPPLGALALSVRCSSHALSHTSRAPFTTRLRHHTAQFELDVTAYALHDRVVDLTLRRRRLVVAD